MAGYFVDSNVFLRFYTADDPVQQAIARDVFLNAKSGDFELFCGPPVFFEIAWVLNSRYKIPNAQILDMLESILAIPNMYVFDGDYVKQSISLAREKGQSYPDAYISVIAREKHIGVISFNRKHFSKLDVALYPLG